MCGSPRSGEFLLALCASVDAVSASWAVTATHVQIEGSPDPESSAQNIRFGFDGKASAPPRDPKIFSATVLATNPRHHRGDPRRGGSFLSPFRPCPHGWGAWLD